MPVWTEYMETPLGTQPGIAISGKLTVYGHYLGVMMVGIDLDRLARFLTALKVTSHGRAFILDQGQRVLTASEVGTTAGGWHELAAVKDPLAGAIERAIAEHKIDLVHLTMPHNVAVMGSMDDIAHYVTFTPLPFRHWMIVTVIPAEDILGDIPAATRRLYMLVIGLVIAVSLIGAFVAHRLISRPIAGIAGQMRQIERFHLENLASQGTGRSLTHAAPDGHRPLRLPQIHAGRPRGDPYPRRCRGQARRPHPAAHRALHRSRRLHRPH
jgi:hypothetical protein